jgi:hypothetical protein
MSAALCSAASTINRTCSEAAVARDSVRVERLADRRSASTSSASIARCSSTASGS